MLRPVVPIPQSLSENDDDVTDQALGFSFVVLSMCDRGKVALPFRNAHHIKTIESVATVKNLLELRSRLVVAALLLPKTRDLKE